MAFRPSYVYRLYGKDARLLYIGGVTRDLTQRLGNHQSQRPAEQWDQVVDMTVEVYTDRYAAEDAERAAILAERPPWNVQTVRPAVVSPIRKPVRGRAESPEQSRLLVWTALHELGRPALCGQVATAADRGHTITRRRLAELVSLGHVMRAGDNRWTSYSAVGPGPAVATAALADLL